MHLLEEFSSFKLIGSLQTQPVFSPLQAPDPPRVSTPNVAKRSYKGSIENLELLKSLKLAIIARQPEMKEQFEKDIQEIDKKLKKLKGMN